MASRNRTLGGAVVEGSMAGGDRVPWSRVAFGVVGAVLAVLLILAPAYGFHRDEPYYVIAGRHPAFGYPDQPPLTPLLSAGAVALLGTSPLAVRILPAIAIALCLAMTIDMARRFGGRTAAQVVAAIVLSGTFFLAAGHLASTTTFDLLAWTALLWLAVRALDGADPRLWLAVGVVGGLGLENKSLIAMLGVGLALGILVARRFDVVRSPWLWAGAAVAAVMWLPNVAWQASNGWPQLTMARLLAQRAASEGGFVEQVILLSGGPLIVVPILGLGRLLLSGAARPWRAVGWAAIAVLGLVVLTGGKSYYLAGILPPLVASGAIIVEAWLVRGRRRLRAAAAGAVAGAWIVTLGVLVLPIVPPSALASTPVPEVFGESIEQIGWPELVAEVRAAADTLTPDERRVAMVLTANYGEAGILELIGGDLPPVYSGHNGYWDWGPPAEDRSIVIAVVSRGWRPAEIGSCVTTGRVVNEFGLRNEEYGATIQVCRRAPASWANVWRWFRHLD